MDTALPIHIAPTPLQAIRHPLWEEQGIQLLVKREDLNHPTIMGNKWRKLKYNLMEASASGYQKLLTFGGAYANHIYATAAAGQAFGFKTVGIIRGELHRPLNPTLAFAEQCGMELVYMDRTTYRQKNEPWLIDELLAVHGPAYVVPEGGTNPLAIKGTAEIMDDLAELKPDYICCSCGTGGTFAGILSRLSTGQQAIGFPALKGGSFLADDIRQQLKAANLPLPNPESWRLATDFHFGGYAKKTPELAAFISHFEETYRIPLDFIYNGKMFYGLFDWIKKGKFTAGSTIVAIHTGGIRPETRIG